jgi:hypothetical protein
MISNNQLDDLQSLYSQIQSAQKERIQEKINYYISWFNHIRLQCFNDFRNDFLNRKEAADYFKNCKYTSVLFAMLDGKDPTSFIWKFIAKERKNDKQIDTSGVISN